MAPRGFNQHQLSNLAKWGSPFVFDQFHFHMTLTGPVDRAEREHVQLVLMRYFGTAPILVTVDRLVLSVQEETHDTSVWLDTNLMESEPVLAWLRFHTASPVTTDPTRANFALVSSADALPTLEQFALGTDEYPDRSTTIALHVPSLTGGADLALRGPGINDHAHIAPQGLPDRFLEQWTQNRGEFPRGIDLLLVSGAQVLGLPRTTRITMEAH